MAEKVIGEIRYIETDDGFRIEMKGDKERLKEMGWRPGMMGSRGMGYGRKHFWRDMWRGHEAGTHHHGAHRHGFGPNPGVSGAPWSCWGRAEEEAGESGNYEKPPKKV